MKNVEFDSFISESKQGTVRAIRFNVDGNYCLTCGSDKTLKLWNPFKRMLLKTYIGHGLEVMDAQGSCDNSQLVSCGTDKNVILWDVTTGNTVRKYRGHLSTVNSVAFNEESTVAISGSVDTSVRCWDLKSKRNEPIQILGEGTDSVTSVSVSSYEVLAGCADGRVRRYDLRNGKLDTDDLVHSITSVRLTKDGQGILCSCSDSTVRLIDKDSGELLSEYKGHTHNQFKIDSCTNHSDTHVVSGSEDGCVYFWSLIDGTITHRLRHEGARIVHSIAYHPTKNCFISAAEGRFWIWQESEQETEE
ncbi:WD repeat domain-containing protein 83-like [Artemia franciscana]|uniref:WD repeat domain-containing protein 83 n=1 Tax=Artemia franciscana TaxID=6661 RepID=A0AA88LCA5_ARTSF|nr:hypothetical protein QYM36_001554 [Artemia franciscana]